MVHTENDSLDPSSVLVNLFVGQTVLPQGMHKLLDTSAYTKVHAFGCHERLAFWSDKISDETDEAGEGGGVVDGFGGEDEIGAACAEDVCHGAAPRPADCGDGDVAGTELVQEELPVCVCDCDGVCDCECLRAPRVPGEIEVGDGNELQDGCVKVLEEQLQRSPRTQRTVQQTGSRQTRPAANLQRPSQPQRTRDWLVFVEGELPTSAARRGRTGRSSM